MTEFTSEWIAICREEAKVLEDDGYKAFTLALDHIEQQAKRIEELEIKQHIQWDANMMLTMADNSKGYIDLIIELQTRLKELEQERRVYCTEDGIYPLKGDDVFFQLEDGKTHIGYYTENEGSVFISNNNSYAYWVEEGEKIYWKLFNNLQESYEQQTALPQPPKEEE